MRIEREHDRRPINLLGVGHQALHDPRMSQMHAVEIADRYRAATQCLRKLVD